MKIKFKGKIKELKDYVLINGSGDYIFLGTAMPSDKKVYVYNLKYVEWYVV